MTPDVRLLVGLLFGWSVIIFPDWQEVAPPLVHTHLFYLEKL